MDIIKFLLAFIIVCTFTTAIERNQISTSIGIGLSFAFGVALGWVR